MAHANPRGNRQALCVLIGADRRIDHLVGHGIGQFFAVILGNDRQHHINRRSAARCGDARAVDNENRFGQIDLGKFFKEAVLILPMDRCLAPIQQTRLGQSKGGCTQPRDCHALACFAPQPIQDLFLLPLHL